MLPFDSHSLYYVLYLVQLGGQAEVWLLGKDVSNLLLVLGLSLFQEFQVSSLQFAYVFSNGLILAYLFTWL